MLADYPLAELRDYIDWQPFFNAWEMKGRFPDILNNPASGEAARKLYDDAQEMLDRIVEEGWLHANGVRRAVPGQRGRRRHRGLHRRVPHRGAARRCTTCASRASTATAYRNRSLADFVAPKETGLADHVGAFAVTAGLGGEDKVKEFKDAARRLLRDPARVARRPARRGVRRAAARAGAHRALGLRARRATSTTRTCSRSSTTASGRPPATPPAPTTPRRPRSGTCSTSRSTPASRSPRAWPCGPAPRSAASTSRTRSRSTSCVGPDRQGPGRGLRRAARACRLAEAERWLSPNLGYEPED